MKKVIAIFALMFLAFNFQVFAQDKTAETKQQKLTAQERTDKVVAEMTTELSLTTAQSSLVAPIVLDAFQKLDANRVTNAANKEMLISVRKQIITDTKDKLKSVLSENQLALLSKYWKANKSRMK